ncbi:MAG: extracellular solute-binding protein [Firmicutes bacterium]|jgi:multiple sugar transport system substrate-binding protein|nr:extracellular solute-binding protein [Bacillota bacterium]
MINRRRCLSLCLAVALGLALAFSCLGSTVKITHLSSGAHSESWQNFLREMKEPFEKANPGYEIEILTDSTPNEKFLVMVAGGISPDVLDLVTHVSAPLIAEDMFYDLNKFLDPQLKSLIPPAMLNALTTPKGLLFMLPIEVYSIVTWYNLDMLRQAGLTPPAELKPGEWTWQLMREYGRKLTKDEDGDGIAEIWGLDRMRSRPYIQAIQAGGNFFDRDIFPRKSLLLSEPVVTAIEFMERLMWEDRVTQPATVGGGTYFYHNKAAIDVVDGPGILGTYMKGVPFEWDVALQPYGPVNNATNVSLNGFQISAHSKHPREAWEWVKFVGTTEQAQRSMASHTGRLPVLARVARAWNTCVPDLPANWMAFFEQSVHPDNIFLKEGMVMDARITNTLTNQLNRVWRGEVSARVALEEADRIITALFAEGAQ